MDTLDTLKLLPHFLVTPTLDVRDLKLERLSGAWRISASIGPSEVFFECSKELSPSPEAYLSAFLFPMMSGGASLRSEMPVCADWARNVRTARALAKDWWGFRGGDVKAPLVVHKPSGTRTGLFFTGGVDSFHVLLSNLDQIDALIFVEGYDIKLDDSARLAATKESIEAVAASLGLELISIRTNLRLNPIFYLESWGGITHGAALAAVAHALSPTVSRFFIGSTDAPPPHGSYPSLDESWSSGSVELINFGSDSSRLEKVQFISASALVHSHLRVCWENRGSDLNCGHCEKCVRTQLQFAAAGALDRLEVFEKGRLVERIAALGSIPPHLFKQWNDVVNALADEELKKAVEQLIANSGSGDGNDRVHADKRSNWNIVKRRRQLHWLTDV